ncbi:ferulic acid esterase [Saccharopolyspora sp. ID03-671]|uniref:alpha/beta hydrolase family esterase n=1 Tax=Saccharopolyspora sp. ID03-671 TaxID=3073066 RepID=UPI00324EF9E0
MPDLRVRGIAVHSIVAAAVVLLAAPAHAEVPGAPGTSGCGNGDVRPGETVSREIVSGGVARSYLLHVPESYAPARPTPVVLSFHGHSRDSAYQEELSEFSGTDVIAVYPQGLVGTDGETAWQGAPYSADVDDVRFTGDVLDELERDLCVDPARIYAAGKSNGGGFTGVLACRMSDRIAAFAPVSGAFYPQGGECDPDRPAPILDFHGAVDETIPYDGDEERGLPPIPDWLAGWAERNGCRAEPVTRDEGDGVHRVEHRGCDGGAEVVHYRMDSVAHDWPATHPNPDSDAPAPIDATPLIMDFFSRHSLR